MKLTTAVLNRCIVGILSLSVLYTAHAKDDGTDPSVTIEKNIESYLINADGSFVMTKEVVFLINEDRAVKAQGQEALSYNRTLETLDVVEAYTQKPDGRKVVVQPDHIKEQQEGRSAAAPMFQDTRVKTIVFSEVAVGDRLVFQYKVNRTTPYFPSQFSDLESPNAYPIKEFRRIYDLPESMVLHADAIGFSASVSSGKGRNRYQWDYVPSERHRLEIGSVSYLDYGNRLAVSTFADFAAYARAYDARAKDKVIVTPKIRALAEKITTGLTDPRAKALALGDWMRKNIRYVAVYIGAGGVVPHPADTILDNLYGDCKDHVTLLEAMLTAVSIDSTPALINADNSYRLQKIPTGFNHVITFVPSLNLYMDSTAEQVASGYLPDADVDKSILLTKSGKMAHTPSSQKIKTISASEFNIESNGAANFTHSITWAGASAEPLRYTIRNIKVSDLDMLVERLLQANGQKGSGKVDTGKVDGVGDDYQLKLNGRSDNLVNLPGPVGVPTMTSLLYGIAAQAYGFASEKDRTQDFACGNNEMEEHSRFNIPKEISIVAVPKPMALHDANIDFTSEYIREENAIVINRSYRFHHAGMVCTAEEFKAMHPTIDQMIRDIRSQIIVQTM
jgi:transglutaminase-like putative cysteine protease